MTETAQLLTAAHAAHRNARAVRKAGDEAQFVELCAESLALRIQARQTDPEYTDPVWRLDLQNSTSHPDMKGQRRDGRKSVFELIAEQDALIETYLRDPLTKLGRSQVDLTDEAIGRIFVPTAKPGQRQMAEEETEAHAQLVKERTIADDRLVALTKRQAFIAKARPVAEELRHAPEPPK